MFREMVSLSDLKEQSVWLDGRKSASGLVEALMKKPEERRQTSCG